MTLAGGALFGLLVGTVVVSFASSIGATPAFLASRHVLREARIDSLAGIVSPGLLGSFVLLGIFPLVPKKIVDISRGRKVYRRWPRPTNSQPGNGSGRTSRWRC